MPAMNDDAIFLTYRVDCIAGKPPPTKRVHSADYLLFDKRRLACTAFCQSTFFDCLYAIADKPPSSFKGFVRQGAGCNSVTNSA
ncbi:hypothetical protein [Pseudomonas viridiflava]|uniref:hypothetical protein n=1 Tax=Pseudomonas viridiflava TaxID=33069 RepID=UPI0013CF35B3|nr:hypothetical protein [Pseudomonas viridiflava]